MAMRSENNIGIAKQGYRANLTVWNNKLTPVGSSGEILNEQTESGKAGHQPDGGRLPLFPEHSRPSVCSENPGVTVDLDALVQSGVLENPVRLRYPLGMTRKNSQTLSAQFRLRGAMVGMGMIFDDTYRPLFEQVHRHGMYDRRFGLCEVDLVGVASRTGQRAEAYRRAAKGKVGDFQSFVEPD